jgi:hypothetical protein
VLVAALALVLGLGAVAIATLVNANSSGIPTVSDIQSTIVDDTVTFTWPDPGLRPGDNYQIAPDDGTPPVQQRDASFTVDSEPGERVCITVSVNREGKTGAASGQKCADIPG